MKLRQSALTSSNASFVCLLSAFNIAIVCAAPHSLWHQSVAISDTKRRTGEVRKFKF